MVNFVALGMDSWIRPALFINLKLSSYGWTFHFQLLSLFLAKRGATPKSQCLKILKKSHLNIASYGPTFTFWVDESSLKMPKLILGDFSNNVEIWKSFKKWLYSCYIVTLELPVASLVLSVQWHIFSIVIFSSDPTPHRFFIGTLIEAAENCSSFQ